MRTSIEYEDSQVIVAYKPAGFAVQTAGVGQPDMVSELKNYVKGGYLGIVHRLDQPVEGLLVFGKTREAAASLTRQLGTGTLHKHYYAVICGVPAKTQDELTDYLKKSPDRRAEIVPAEQAESAGARRAVLRYRLLGTQNEKCSLLDIHIDTGRFHQIRAQLSHAGLPILGDMKYGTEQSGQMSRELSVGSVALCACELTFLHPVSRESLCYQIVPRGGIFQKFDYDFG